MKIWGIKAECKAEVEDILRNVSPKQLGLSLAMLAQPEGESDIKVEAGEWMDTYLPELRFV